MNCVKNVNPTEINALRNTRSALQRPEGEVWGSCPCGNCAQVYLSEEVGLFFPYFRISFAPWEMPPEQLHQVSVLFLGLAVNICVAPDLEFQGLDLLV